MIPALVAKPASASARRGLSTLAAVLPVALLALACSDGGGSYGGEGEPAAGAAAAATARPVKKLTFMAGFKPQANLPFVGAYVAQEKGYFREQGLDVEIRHAQSGEHLQLLLAGEVQITTASGASVLKRNAQDLEIVSVALVGQKSEQGFAVLADSGIDSVADWSGKTFGYKGSVPAEFLALARANGLDPASVRQVRVGFDPRILSEGQVDILAVFVSNEPDILAGLGFPTRLFDPSDFGVSSLGLAYVSSREFVAADPDAVERFLKAVLKGIAYAADYPAEAVDIVLGFAPQENRAHQRAMLDTELDRALTGAALESGIGWQTAAQWQGAHDTLVEFESIEKPVDVATVFTDEFLRRIYRNGELIWP